MFMKSLLQWDIFPQKKLFTRKLNISKFNRFSNDSTFRLLRLIRIDKSTDFSKYKTYTFAGWQKNSDQVLNDIDKKRILDAFKAEFASRNMTLVTENGDATVSLYLVIDKKTSTTAYTDFNGGMGYGIGMRRGWGMGVGGLEMGSATTTYNQNDYNEGTLVVDLYDGGK